MRPVLVMLLLSVPMLVLGLDWGLPTRESDRVLFGDRLPWTGQEIIALAGDWKPGSGGGADVDQAALDRSQPVALNDTDAKRAELVRRWRLYTSQPDELINLRAFSGMRPGSLQLDPRLYQYGGVWFYPVAAFLKVSSLIGLCELRTDLAYYLDRPEAMGRLYLLMRVATLAWALAGVAAIYALARQMNAKPWVAALGGLAWATMPGIVVFSHEAKPHVTGVTLLLWSVWAGVEYLKAGLSSPGKDSPQLHSLLRSWGTSAVFAGLSFGAVVSMLPAVLIPLMAVWFRRERVAVRMMAVLAVFAGTYFLTNPYVLKHLLLDPATLTGQLGNSTAMYRVAGGSAFINAFSTSFYLLVMLTPSILVVFMAGSLASKERWWPAVLKIMGPAALVLLAIFVVLSAGKPGEYARFGLIPASFGVLCAVYLATRFRQQGPLLVVVIVLHLLLSVPEVLGYWRDAREGGLRRDAQVFDSDWPSRLTLRAEPAPYNTPLFDLWKTELVLLPRDTTERPLLSQPPYSDGYWKMSWADRSVGLSRGLDRPMQSDNTSR